ncbi:MAG: hypothetical protein NTW04_02690, partial [Elusimicrobia bacterium]|nr:hypothetical protein [Elusimicrobiota bacterium]
MKPNRLLILFLPLFFGSSPAFCAKLDISADTDVKAVSYSNINFTQSKNFFYIQNASLAVKIKSLKPSIPSKSDSSIDIGIVLRSVGISGSTVSASYPPFERA